MSVTRMALPRLSKFGTSTQCGEHPIAAGSDEAGETNATTIQMATTTTTVTRMRNNNISNKRLQTGLATGPAMASIRKPVDSQTIGMISGSSGFQSGIADIPTPPRAEWPIPATPFPGPFPERATHQHDQSHDPVDKERPLCLPPIETNVAGADEPSVSRTLRVADSTLLLTSPTDAAYIRSRSVTPSLLGAPRDLLPRSKKPTLFAGYLPGLPQQDDEGCATDLPLTIEGHQDLKLPPRRTPTESRRTEKSRHKLAFLTHVSQMTDGHVDNLVTIEETLRKLLLCQSMGVKIEINNRQHDFVPGKTARPVFHCPRCMQHWTENGTTPDDCDEQEIPTAGPTFNITNHSHEIMQEFETLTPEDKRQVLAAVTISKASIQIGGSDDTDVDSVMDVTMTGRRADTKGLEDAEASRVNGTGQGVEGSTRFHGDDRDNTHAGGSNNAYGRDRRWANSRNTQLSSHHADGEHRSAILSNRNRSIPPHGVSNQPPMVHQRRQDMSGENTTCNTPGTHEAWGVQQQGQDDGHGFGSRQRTFGTDSGAISGDVLTLTDRYTTKPDRKLYSGESTSHSTPDEIGQYGPDGSFYPGQYDSDGRFIAKFRIERHGERRGERQPVMMGPDGRLYVNASYKPDGQFHIDLDAEEVGVEFLSAAEMTALKAKQRATKSIAKQGVVGPDGFYYPNGSFQTDGSFVPGGPPHSGHSIVWGPTAGGGPGLYYPPSEFGPAWPPGTPAPYHPEHSGYYGPVGGAGCYEDFYSDEESNTTDGNGAMAARQTTGDIIERCVTDTTPCVTAHFTDDAIFDANEDLEDGAEDRDQPTPRDLFSPWDMDDDERLKDAATAAVKAGTPSGSAPGSASKGDIAMVEETEQSGSNDVQMNVNIVTSGARTKECSRRETPGEKQNFVDRDIDTVEDLEKDEALKNLDSRILFLESSDDDDDDIAAMDDKGQQQSIESSSIKMRADTSMGNKKASEQQDTKELMPVNSSTRKDGLTPDDGNDAVRTSKSKAAPTAYMGIIDGADSKNASPSSQHNAAVKTASRRGSVFAEGRTGSGMMRRGSVKPAKNLAVRNVTGKPETKPGVFQKHMLATPLADLTQTNTMGINRGSVDTIGSSTKGSSGKSQDEPFAAKSKLPSIGGGEPSTDSTSATTKPNTASATATDSINNLVGSGELLSEADGHMSPDNTVKPSKPRSGRRGTKAIVKKAAKDTRKSVARPRQNGGATESDNDQIDDRRESSITPTRQPPTLGNCNGDNDTEKTNYVDRLTASSPTKSSTVLDTFSKFRLELPESTSPLPTEPAPSFRMTYSTLPSSFGSSGLPQSTAPDRIKEAKSASQKKVESFDFEEGYDIRARKSSSTRTLRGKKSGSSKTSSKSRLRGSYSTGTTSSSARASQSSSTESVWESISEIWKRHKKEVADMRKYQAESYLPLTHAFTFSMYTLPPGYEANNRMLRQRAAGIKYLRKPPKLNKPRAAAKPRKAIGGKYVAPVK